MFLDWTERVLNHLFDLFLLHFVLWTYFQRLVYEIGQTILEWHFQRCTIVGRHFEWRYKSLTLMASKMNRTVIQLLGNNWLV